MKRIYTLIFSLCITFSAFAQGTINSISFSPANPSDGDTLLVIANLSFTSGACPLDYKSVNIMEHTILAISHHCLGIAAYICSSTDTFKIAPLAAGTYKFDLTLTSGGLPIPCTPGIVIDDQDSIFITVNTTAGIEESSLSGIHFTNPARDKLVFSQPLPEEAHLISITGQLIRVIEEGETETDISELQPGVYLIKMNGTTRRLVVI